MEAPVLVRVSVPCDEQAPAAVRAALSRVSDETAIGDAMLIASELVTNAVRHSGCAADERLDVSVERHETHLLISVTDPGRSGKTARVPDPGDGGFGGLGLRVVEELTSRWGQERVGGYRVWAEVPLEAPATPA